MPARLDGKQGHKSDKLWRDALMVAVKREGKANGGKPTKKLAELAEKTVKMALEGDTTLIKEIGDRLDGKAHQSVAVSGDLTQWVVSEKELSPDEWQREYGNAVKGNGAGKGNGSA